MLVVFDRLPLHFTIAYQAPSENCPHHPSPENKLVGWMEFGWVGGVVVPLCPGRLKGLKKKMGGIYGETEGGSGLKSLRRQLTDQTLLPLENTLLPCPEQAGKGSLCLSLSLSHFFLLCSSLPRYTHHTTTCLDMSNYGLFLLIE